jgi:hypothetical protein
MIRIPGTRVSLEPPAGFRVVPQGLEDDARGLSITVTELPQPVGEVGGEAVMVDGHRGFSGSAVVTGGLESLQRWWVVFGDGERSVLLAAAAPVGIDGSDIRACLLGARWEPGDGVVLDDLPYRLDEAPPLRIATRMGAVVLLTEGGTVGLTVGSPMMTVGHLPAGDGDLATVAAAHLEGLPGLEGVSATAAEEVILGEPALELLADGLGPDAVEIRVYQLATRIGAHEVVAVGRSSADRFEALLPAFRAVGRSLRRPP